MEKTITLDSANRIPTFEKVVYGGGLVGGNIINLMLGFLLAYYTDTVFISAAAVSTMFVIVRILDAFADILMGTIIDKTNSRWGKVKPWLFASAPLMIVGIVFIFAVPLGYGDQMKLVYAYVTYILFNIIFTMYNVSYYTLLSRMSLDSNERTICGVMGSVLTTIAGVLLSASIMTIITKYGWMMTAAFAGVICAILIGFVVLITKERVDTELVNTSSQPKLKLKETLPFIFKNKYFYMIFGITFLATLLNSGLGTAAIFYSNHILKNPGFIGTILVVSQAVGFFALITLPVLIKKFSKQKIMAVGCLVTIIGFIIAAIAGSNANLVILSTVIRSLGVAPIAGLGLGLVGDVVDYGEWKTGVRTDGMIISARSFGMKMGLGFGTAIPGWIYAMSGYDGKLAVQPQSAYDAIQFTFGWFNVILTILLFAIVIFLNIEKNIPQMRADLEAKKNN